MKTHRFAAALLLTFGPAVQLWAEEQAGALEPIFITANRTPTPLKDLPTNTTIITAEEIAQSGAKTLDEALEHVVSVDVSKTGILGSFSTVRMRGAPSSAHVQILIDDMPASGISHQSIDLSQIPTDNIERIEIVRGGSSTLYGANAVGGIINVITKRHSQGKTAQSAVGFELRSYDTNIYKGMLGVGSDKTDAFITASRSFTDGFQQNSDADNVSIAGNAGVNLGNGGRLSADLSRITQEAGDSQGTLVPISEWDGKKEKEAVNKTDRVEQRATRGQTRLVTPLGGIGQIDAMVFGTNTQYEAISTYPADYRNQTFGSDVHATLFKNSLLGFSYERDERRDFITDSSIHVIDWAAYAQQLVSLGPVLLTPALRVDQHSAFGNQWSPRLSVVYNAAEKWKLSANAAQAFRAPSLTDLYQDFPSYGFTANPQLIPETVTSYDVGVAVGDPAAMLAVTGFKTLIKDRISGVNLDSDPFNETNQNVGRAHMEGVEIEISQMWRTLKNKANYTYTAARGDSKGLSDVPLRLTPRHNANLISTLQPKPSLKFINTLSYTGESFESDGEQGAKIPSYFLWDFGFIKTILAADFTFYVKNITDRHYAEIAAGGVFNPLPGRNYWGGVTIRFKD